MLSFSHGSSLTSQGGVTWSVINLTGRLDNHLIRSRENHLFPTCFNFSVTWSNLKRQDRRCEEMHSEIPNNLVSLRNVRDSVGSTLVSQAADLLEGHSNCRARHTISIVNVCRSFLTSSYYSVTQNADCLIYINLLLRCNWNGVIYTPYIVYTSLPMFTKQCSLTIWPNYWASGVTGFCAKFDIFHCFS